MNKTNVAPGPVARQKRQERAASREAAHDPAAQLQMLDSRLGKDRGAKKERAKLKALLNGAPKKKKRGK